MASDCHLLFGDRHRDKGIPNLESRNLSFSILPSEDDSVFQTRGFNVSAIREIVSYYNFGASEVSFASRNKIDQPILSTSRLYDTTTNALHFEMHLPEPVTEYMINVV